MFDLSIRYDPSLRIVRTTTFGTLNVAAIQKMVVAAVAAGAEHGAERYLLDHRNVELAVGILAISDLPTENQKLGVKPSFRIAIICRDEPSVCEKFEFLENLYYIAGINRRVFTDEPTALDWLQRDTLN